MNIGAWSCGMVAGLIKDIPSCQQLVDSIMTDAEPAPAWHALSRQALMPVDADGPGRGP